MLRERKEMETEHEEFTGKLVYLDCKGSNHWKRDENKKQTPETNTILQTNYTSIKKKKNQEADKSNGVDQRGAGWHEENMERKDRVKVKARRSEEEN